MKQRDAWREYAITALRSGVSGPHSAAAADAVLAAEEKRFGPLEPAERGDDEVRALRERVRELEGELATALKERDEARHERDAATDLAVVKGCAP